MFIGYEGLRLEPVPRNQIKSFNTILTQTKLGASPQFFCFWVLKQKKEPPGGGNHGQLFS